MGQALLGLSVALGIGLLIGAERERRRSLHPTRFVAGVRTFALVALAGAVSLDLGGPGVFAIVTAIVGGFATISAWTGRNSDDPGLTTEVALVLTLLLGGLAVRDPSLAGMAGVATAILLAARTPLHRFVGSVLTEREVRDALILAGATLIVLPLLPNRTFGPYDVFNPRSVWVLVILVLSVGAAGHVAVRLVGARFGLPIAGLLGGFVSSTATIGAMGGRAKSNPNEMAGASAGAVLSNVATMLQMAIVLGAISQATLRAAAPSIVAGGVAAIAWGLVSMLRAIRQPPAPAAEDKEGGAFSLKSALLFAGTVSLVLLVSAVCRAQFGNLGLSLAAGVAGLADAHAAGISVASLVAAGQVRPDEALVPILIGISTNTLMKLTFASASGGKSFLLRVGPGLLLMTAAIWAPVLLRFGA